MNRWVSIILCFSFLLLQNIFAQEKIVSGTAPTYRFSGNAKLMSDFIDRGLTMTDHNPALNASFLYNFGSQFKFGFWGSNIARLNNIDDNFWLKLVGEIKVDFHDKASMRFYIHDDHFYKADVRNGQSLGFILDYGFYTVQLEYLNNYQGSHTPAQYLNVGKSFLFKKGYIAGGKLGFTMLSASSFKDYFDAKAFGGYVFSEHTSVEAGITLTSDAGNVYGRGRPALYFAAELIY